MFTLYATNNIWLLTILTDVYTLPLTISGYLQFLQMFTLYATNNIWLLTILTDVYTLCH